MNLKELQLQKWALDGILITRVTQDEADAAPWTRFVNRGTVKSCQIPWLYVMIQSTWKDAENLFTTLFGFKPSEIHCEMCGPHFSMDTLCELFVYPGGFGQDTKALCIKEADIQGIIASRYEILPGEDPDKGFEISDMQMTHDTLECSVTIKPQPEVPNLTMQDVMGLVNKLNPVSVMYKPSDPNWFFNPKFASSYSGGMPWAYVNFKGGAGIADWDAWDVVPSKPKKK